MPYILQLKNVSLKCIPHYKSNDLLLLIKAEMYVKKLSPHSKGMS